MPIQRINRHHWTTEAVGEELLPVKQLLFSAIAPTVTSLFTAETLLVVVNRVVTTTQVAAIVAEWEIVLLTFRFQRYWSKQPTLVIVGHVPITVPALHL